jgi:hypothetical protein
MNPTAADIAWMKRAQTACFRDTGSIGTKLLGATAGDPNEGKAIHVAIDLGATAQDITTAITNPATPSNLMVRGNRVGVTGTVTITGTNSSDAALVESFTLAGMAAKSSTGVFKTVTKVAVPIQHASGDQVLVFASWTWATAQACGFSDSPAGESGTGESPITPAILRLPVGSVLRSRDIFKLTHVGGTALSPVTYLRAIGEQNRGLTAYISRVEVITGPLP